MKRKTTEDLRLHGNYRADRHANRERVPQTGVDPKPMAKLTGEALKFWKQIVPELIELKAVSSLDSAELTALSEWWGEYRKRMGDTKADGYKRAIGMASAYKQFRTLAAKFYLTPTDRVGMPCGIQIMDGVRRRNQQRTDEDELDALIS